MASGAGMACSVLRSTASLTGARSPASAAAGGRCISSPTRSASRPVSSRSTSTRGRSRLGSILVAAGRCSASPGCIGAAASQVAQHEAPRRQPHAAPSQAWLVRLWASPLLSAGSGRSPSPGRAGAMGGSPSPIAGRAGSSTAGASAALHPALPALLCPPPSPRAAGPHDSGASAAAGRSISAGRTLGACTASCGSAAAATGRLDGTPRRLTGRRSLNFGRPHARRLDRFLRLDGRGNRRLDGTPRRLTGRRSLNFGRPHARRLDRFLRLGGRGNRRLDGTPRRLSGRRSLDFSRPHARRLDRFLRLGGRGNRRLDGTTRRLSGRRSLDFGRPHARRLDRFLRLCGRGNRRLDGTTRRLSGRRSLDFGQAARSALGPLLAALTAAATGGWTARPGASAAAGRSTSAGRTLGAWTASCGSRPQQQAAGRHDPAPHRPPVARLRPAARSALGPLLAARRPQQQAAGRHDPAPQRPPVAQLRPAARSALGPLLAARRPRQQAVGRHDPAPQRPPVARLRPDAHSALGPLLAARRPRQQAAGRHAPAPQRPPVAQLQPDARSALGPLLAARGRGNRRLDGTPRRLSGCRLLDFSQAARSALGPLLAALRPRQQAVGRHDPAPQRLPVAQLQPGRTLGAWTASCGSDGRGNRRLDGTTRRLSRLPVAQLQPAAHSALGPLPAARRPRPQVVGRHAPAPHAAAGRSTSAGRTLGAWTACCDSFGRGHGRLDGTTRRLTGRRSLAFSRTHAGRLGRFLRFCRSGNGWCLTTHGAGDFRRGFDGQLGRFLRLWSRRDRYGRRRKRHLVDLRRFNIGDLCAAWGRCHVGDWLLCRWRGWWRGQGRQRTPLTRQRDPVSATLRARRHWPRSGAGVTTAAGADASGLLSRAGSGAFTPAVASIDGNCVSKVRLAGGCLAIGAGPSDGAGSISSDAASAGSCAAGWAVVFMGRCIGGTRDGWRRRRLGLG